MNRQFKALIAISFAAFLSTAYGNAAQDAIESCADKGEGDSCEVMNKQGDSISGICHTKGPDGKLVCVPNN